MYLTTASVNRSQPRSLWELGLPWRTVRHAFNSSTPYEKKSQINNAHLNLGLSLTSEKPGSSSSKPGPRATYGQPSNLMWPTTTAFNNTCFAHPSKNPWFGISNPSMSDFSSLYMLTREGGAGTPFWTEKQSPWAWKRHFWFHLNVFAKNAWTIRRVGGNQGTV